MMGEVRVERAATKALSSHEIHRAGWQPHDTWWVVQSGMLRLWRADDFGSVLVEHPTGVSVEIPLPVWFGVKSRRPELESRVFFGIQGPIGDDVLTISRPGEGPRRTDRRLRVAIGAQRYSYAASGPWMSGQSSLVREGDDAVVFRRRWPGRDALQDQASPVEETVAAVLTVANAHDRVTPRWVKLI